MSSPRLVLLVTTLALGACSGSSPAVDAALTDLPPDTAVADAMSPPVPSIDGAFEDWSSVSALATDAAGDASGAFDLTTVKAFGRGSMLYLLFNVGKELNAGAGAATDGTLRLELALPGRLTVDLRAHALYTDGDPAQALKWTDVAYAIAPTYASTRFEARIDLARFGVKAGDRIKIDFAGSDALPAPAEVVMGPPAASPAARSLGREPGTSLRIASNNTYLDGLGDPARQARVGRLVKAAAADIYCFQELGTTDVAATLKAIDPRGDGATWNVHKVLDVAIASRATLNPLPQSTNAIAGAALELGGKPLVVFSLRTTCCGYAGDPSDVARVQQMTEVAGTIKKLRDGALGTELLAWRDAQVVVVGDWNLVGSRKPLDVMLDPSGPALSHWQLRHVTVDDVFTWRSEKVGEFPPGMLDVLVHSPAKLQRKNGFILDTADLDAPKLGQLGLQANDSQASDHLWLVADFELR
jgi:hypothetical protein